MKTMLFLYALNKLLNRVFLTTMLLGNCFLYIVMRIMEMSLRSMI